jgi:3-oxoacyl-[acyl-carrier protein] reductase
VRPDLQGKKAVVTGGSRGIGLAIARGLCSAGAHVAICGRDETALAAAVESLARDFTSRVWGAVCNVSEPRQVAAFFTYVDENLGGLHILVNNAGIGRFAPAAELEIDHWREVIETNLSGAYYCSRQAILRMKKSGGGSIINIGSLAGKNPFAGGAAYNASKFGLVGFTEALMLDYRHENIRVSDILPGSVATEFGRGGSEFSWKIAPEDVSDIVLAILSMPERTLVSRVEVRPSKPGR